jgi:chromosome partitioning protein
MAKGGVGKTTSAVNLSCGLAASGKKVLLIDCDTQNQVVRFLGVKPRHGLYEFVTERRADGSRISRNETLLQARENLWVLAGGIELVELKNWLGEQERDIRHGFLASRLVPRNDLLDYVIFDCAPGWDLLSVNILMAAEEVLCPVALQGPCMEGLKTFFRYLQSVQKHNSDLRLEYVLPTMFDRRLKQTFVIYHQLQRFFARQLCDPIRYNVRLSEAPGTGQSIFEYNTAAAGSVDYDRLVRRILADENNGQG